ncbi:hypothetical protein Tco_0327658 [Tanacetum coccineum]
MSKLVFNLRSKSDVSKQSKPMSVKNGFWAGYDAKMIVFFVSFQMSKLAFNLRSKSDVSKQSKPISRDIKSEEGKLRKTWVQVEMVVGTDKTKITRKPSKMGKHGHENGRAQKKPGNQDKVKKSKLSNSSLSPGTEDAKEKDVILIGKVKQKITRGLERAQGMGEFALYLLKHKAYWALRYANFDLKIAGDHRKLELNELNELRDQAYENYLIYKERTKKLHDSKIKNRILNVGDRVLLFNSRLKIFSRKLKTRWSGPFTITKVFPYGTVELSQPDGPTFKVNGHRVKHYFGGDIPPKVVPDLQTFSKDE